MLMRNVILLLYLFIISTVVYARHNEELSINGNRADKNVIEISFEDSVVILHWSDNTTTSNKIADTMTKLACVEGIDKAHIASISGIYEKEILISGTKPGTSINIYDIAGNRLQNIPSVSPTTPIDISHFNTGIYLIQDKNTVIKFVKR